MTKTSRKLFMLGAATAVLAQAAGADVLTGTVTDATGEAGLQGALVTIEELGRTTSADRFGTYRFANIPADAGPRGKPNRPQKSTTTQKFPRSFSEVAGANL